jgi:hypothetical protein
MPPPCASLRPTNLSSWPPCLQRQVHKENCCRQVDLTRTKRTSNLRSQQPRSQTHKETKRHPSCSTQRPMSVHVWLCCACTYVRVFYTFASKIYTTLTYTTTCRHTHTLANAHKYTVYMHKKILKMYSHICRLRLQQADLLACHWDLLPP